MTPIAPGTRIEVRDELWIVRKVDPSSDGGHLYTCDGVSELVRDKNALFLSKLEDDIEVLDPADTKLVADKLEIDLITKDSKITMNNKQSKIKIIRKK